MIALLASPLARWAAVGLLLAGGAWWLRADGYAAGEAAQRASQAAQIEAARRAHATEVARIADRASAAEAEALTARATVREMTDALRRQPAPACAVAPADRDRLRAILDAARGAAPAAPAR